MSWGDYRLTFPDDTPLVAAPNEDALHPIAAALAALPGAACALFALGALVVSLTALVGHAAGWWS